MIGYLPKHAGQQLPRPKMCRRRHTRALPTLKALQQIRALHIKQRMGQAELGDKDGLKERAGVVHEAGPRQRFRRCL